MATANGDKSKIIMFLVGLLQTIFLGWSVWMGTSVVEAKSDISALKANYTNIMSELTDIKKILRHNNK